MPIRNVFLLTLSNSLLILNSCRHEMLEQPQIAYIDLNASTNIILQLIHTNELKKVLLEDATKEGIDLLIKNFSPSELAFEADVLNAQIPVVIIFLKTNKESEKLQKIINDVATEFNDQVRFVIIDADLLFKITEQSHVNVFPTISFIHQREEKDRIEAVDLNTIENQIRTLIYRWRNSGNALKENQ